MSKSWMYDALYGRVEFDADIVSLMSAPLVQRLRHVRLSNIDSVASPGIANISRFEHAVGVATLASKLKLISNLPKYDRILIQSSALLHDWAITAFGHLVEEAYAYAGAKFEHEGKLNELVSGENADEVGGVDRQILGGRETGLRKWAISCVGPKQADELIFDITQNILGKGKYGKVIAGSIDIDNIDNIYRVAYHLGLRFDFSTPNLLADSITDVEPISGSPLFSPNSARLIEEWLGMREQVYNHLMLAEPDFTAKLMLICAVVLAYHSGEISASEWNLTDQELVTRLRNSKSRECKDTVERWLVGEYWAASSLVWMAGSRPTFAQLNEFNRTLSSKLGRRMFSYCIKDKRTRKLQIQFDDGSSATYGADSSKWLLGVASPSRKNFSSSDEIKFVECAEEFFETKYLSLAAQDGPKDKNGGEQICLI
jgi:HD superfamily phosphohydrolase